MKRLATLTVGVLILGWMVSVKPAQAQTIQATEHTQNRLLLDSAPAFGQSIDPPSGVNLASFMFRLGVSTEGSWSGQAEIYELDSATTAGAPIWVSSTFQISSWEDKVFNPNIELDGSKIYALIIRKTSPSGSGLIAFGENSYAGGAFAELKTTSQWYIGTKDMYFSATFIPQPDPVEVPTLSEWSMIGLMSVLALGGGWAIRRRRTA